MSYICPMYMEEHLKLKYRDESLYRKYFFNKKEILSAILLSYDNGNEIDDDICQTIIEVSDENLSDLSLLIRYYPNTLIKVKYVNDKVVNDLMRIYSETIEIMEEYIFVKNKANPRDVLITRKGDVHISKEEIILTHKCPVFDVELRYSRNAFDPASAYIVPTANGEFFVGTQACFRQINKFKPKGKRKKRVDKRIRAPKCSSCGETDEKCFLSGFKSLCRNCLNTRKREQYQKKHNCKPRARIYNCECGETDRLKFSRNSGHFCIECHKKNSKKRYKSKKEELIKQSTEWSNNHIIQFRLLGCKSRAKKKGFPFEVDREFVEQELNKINYKVIIVDGNDEIYDLSTKNKIDTRRLSITTIDKSIGFIETNTKVSIR